MQKPSSLLLRLTMLALDLRKKQEMIQTKGLIASYDVELRLSGVEKLRKFKVPSLLISSQRRHLVLRVPDFVSEQLKLTPQLFVEPLWPCFPTGFRQELTHASLPADPTDFCVLWRVQHLHLPTLSIIISPHPGVWLSHARSIFSLLWH